MACSKASSHKLDAVFVFLRQIAVAALSTAEPTISYRFETFVFNLARRAHTQTPYLASKPYLIIGFEVEKPKKKPLTIKIIII